MKKIDLLKHFSEWFDNGSLKFPPKPFNSNVVDWSTGKKASSAGSS